MLMIGKLATMPRSTLIGTILLGTATLAACSSSSDEPNYGCPPITVMQDAASLTRFAGTGRDLLDVDYQAQIADLLMGCKYTDDKRGVIIGVAPVIIVDRGPANHDRKALIEYFVSVVEYGTTIVSKQQFTTAVNFDGNRTRVLLREDDPAVSIDLPVPPQNAARDYDIVIGLQLSASELEYNMRQRSDMR